MAHIQRSLFLFLVAVIILEQNVFECGAAGVQLVPPPQPPA
jgi:hypothetical protein